MWVCMCVEGSQLLGPYRVPAPFGCVISSEHLQIPPPGVLPIRMHSNQHANTSHIVLLLEPPSPSAAGAPVLHPETLTPNPTPNTLTLQPPAPYPCPQALLGPCA